MKKIILATFVVSLLTVCFIFQKKEKLGCKTSGAAVGAERIAAGDEKAMKASKKSKYKGGRKVY